MSNRQPMRTLPPPTADYEPVESSDADRVREHTDGDQLAEIDRAAQERVDAMRGASTQELTQRIATLERESDIERLLEVNASILSLVGLALGLVVNRRFLLLPIVVSAFLLQHGLSGWCPPLPVMRRLGARTRQEIDAEKYAVKALRGDFDGRSRATAR
jgi:hypothetical protein